MNSQLWDTTVYQLEVVEECQKSLPNLDNSGFGLIEVVMEVKHSKYYDSSAEKLRRFYQFLAITVLYLQGGASLQFYMSALIYLEKMRRLIS